MRRALWVSLWCIKSPILWQSLVAAGSCGRYAQLHFTGWPIRLSTRQWWNRWPGAARDMYKSAITVPCVSVLHIIYLSPSLKMIVEHVLFCLVLDFKCLCTCVCKIWWYGVTHCRQTNDHCDLSVCGTAYKTPDGSTETATNILPLIYSL